MAIIYDKKIGKNTDWGGDSSTGYLPVAGNRVQEYIKGELNSKVGAFYKPSGGNFIYCFATVEDKNAYILDPEGNEHLIVDRIETESSHVVKLNRDTLVTSKSVIEGTTGNTIEFQFTITGKDDGFVADSKATIEYSFLSSGNIKKYTSQVSVRSEGWTTVQSDVIDDYLKTGENTITITIQGINTKAQGQFILTYNVFNLVFETNFAYNTAKNENSIEIPYKVLCSEKPINVEFYLDGVKGSGWGEFSVYDYGKEGTHNIPISGLEPGKHTLQARAYIDARDGSKFYSNLHYYSFCVGGEITPVLLVKKELENSHEIISDDEYLYINITQFEDFSINWSLYDYQERRFTVHFNFDGSVISTPVFNTNGKISELSFKPLTYGEGKELSIYAELEEGSLTLLDKILFNVKESPTGIQETTDGLQLKLTAIGRRNTDENYDVWENNGYSATFNNFAWNKQQGWNDEKESLVISNDASVDINIQPMIRNWAEYGGTFEIDLETFDVEDVDAVICECKGVSGSYFRITATNAEFSTADGKKINTRYKDNERLKIAFIGNKTGSYEDDNMIYIVVNGVLERAQMYDNNDRMSSNAYLRISAGNGGCKVGIHSIRVYNRAISVDEAFNNFVIDSPDSQIIYERNNVLKEGTTNEIGFEEVANKLPVMIFTGDMNELVTVGQDKNWRFFDVEYINRQEPERNFTSFNCQIKLQGTSSLGYPRKNFKLKTRNKNFTESATDYYRDKYVVDFENTTEGNRRLRLVGTTDESGLLDFGDLPKSQDYTLTYDYQGQPLNKGKYRFRADAHKATKWTLKADFMESSCSHNVGAGRSWNDIFENTSFEPGNFAGYENKTYRDAALVCKSEYETYTRDDITYRIPRNTALINSQKNYVCRTTAQKICNAVDGADDIRTAIDGFPMVCFYRTSHKDNNLVFMGQYNFINDKGSFEVFGFEDIEDPADETEQTMIYDASKVECWEGLSNTNPISKFITTENWNDETMGWRSTYESRYPDQGDEDVVVDPSALLALSEWVVSTRHQSGETVYGDTITIDARFAKKINLYQYGYNDSNKDSYTYLEDNNDEITLPDTPENRQLKFNVEKWEHFDVWKVAGYYIYLMRYGAVDQFVKNTMLFTDGNGLYDERTEKKYRKWFFLNYDNDCLFGLRNNGQLAFNWDLNRQTKDGAGDIIVDSGDTSTEGESHEYAMMGHDSTLWNNLEADEEFMRMVRDLDNAMCSQKLTYENMVTEFDTKQTEVWCERIYNANERYKYIQAAKGIGDMAGHPDNKLWMLQGTRRSHRHWWIANHFNLLDAQWLSGKYRQTYVQMKTNSPSGTELKATAGTDYYFAWGPQKSIYESNIVKKENDEVVFRYPTDQSQGDPIYIYAINKMSEIDFSNAMPYVYEGSFDFYVGDNEVSNLLKKLVIGKENYYNNAAITTTTWRKLVNLEYLDITNFRGISSLPWTFEEDGVTTESFKNLHVLKAKGSSIGSFIPSEGSRYTNVELPDTISTIILNNIIFNSFANDFKYEPTQSLRKLVIDSSSQIDNSYYNKIIKPWINVIERSLSPEDLYAESEMSVNNIFWRFGDLEDVFLFENFSKYGVTFDLKGVIDLTECGSLESEDVDKLKEIFGEYCFNENNSSIYVKTPNSVFIRSAKTQIVAGDTNIYTRDIYPDESILDDLVGRYEISYSFVKVVSRDYSGETFSNKNVYYAKLTDEEIYALRNDGEEACIVGINKKVDGREIFEVQTKEHQTGNDTDVKIMVCFTIGQSSKISVMDLKIKDPTYAYSGNTTISGEKSLYRNNTYNFDVILKDRYNVDPIGSENITWTLLIGGLGGQSFIIGEDDVQNEYISSVSVENDTKRLVIETSSSQPEISESLYITATVNNGDGSHFDKQHNPLLLNERVILTDLTNPVVMNICNTMGWSSRPDANAFMKDEAEAVTSICNAFKNVQDRYSFNEFKYFTGLTEIDEGAFSNSRIAEITIPQTIEEFGEGVFCGCTSLNKVSTVKNGAVEEYTLDNITEVKSKTFYRCSSLNKLILGDSILTIEDFAFGDTIFTKALIGPEKLDNNVLILPHYIERIYKNAFEITNWSVTNTTNRLSVIEIPLTLNLTNNFEVLYGKYYEEYLAEKREDGTNGPWASFDGVLYNGQMTELVKYPAKKARKSEEEIYSLTELNLDYGIAIEKIYNYAFLFVENLDKVITRQGLNDIGKGCFESSNVKFVDLSSSNGINAIPDNTFKDCVYLSDALLPVNNSIRSIGAYAFNNCPMLTGLTLTEGITDIEASSDGKGYNFVNCGVETINLPNSITGMCDGVISSCNNLVSVSFPEKLTLIPDVKSYISNCQNLQTIELPISSYYDNVVYSVYNSVDELVGEYTSETEANSVASTIEDGGYVLSAGTNVIINTAYNYESENGTGIAVSCRNLEEYTMSSLNNGNECYIYDKCIYTNYYNESVKYSAIIRAPFGMLSANIKDDCYRIYQSAFENCESVTTVNLPDTVSTLGSYSFRNCYLLREITVPGNVTDIPYLCFEGDRSIETIYIKGNNMVIWSSFIGCVNLKNLYIFSDVAAKLHTPYGISSGYHPFGSNGSNYAGRNSNSQGINTIHIFRGTMGSDGSGYTYDGGDSSFYSWVHPVTDTDKCGFSFKEISIDNTGITITVYKNGQLLDNDYIYVTSETGEISLTDDYSVGQKQGDKYFVPVNKLYHGEVFSVYTDSSLTDKICDLTFDFFQNDYVAGDRPLSFGRSVSLKSGVFSSGIDNDVETDLETVTLTRKEYESLISNLKYLNGIINNFVKK